MEEKGWARGQDDEELFELAMHPTQYRDYKTGVARRRFLADLQAAKDKALQSRRTPEEAMDFKHAGADAVVAQESGTLLWEIGGDAAGVQAIAPYVGKHYVSGDTFCYVESAHGFITPHLSALGGQLVELCAQQGATVRRGDVIAYIKRD